MEQSLNMFSEDFLEKDAIRTPEMELKIRMVMEQYHAAMTENAALKDEAAELKERLAWFEKQVYGQERSCTGRCRTDSHVR